MKLYGYYRSSTSYRVRIGLNLKGCIYETAPVNLLAGEQRQDGYLSINLAGTLPTLEWNGERYVQSLAILEMLEERFPSPSFWPERAADRSFARELAYAIATEMHAPNNLRALDWMRQHLGASEEQIREWYAATVRATFDPLEQRLASISTDNVLPFGEPGMFEIMLVPQVYNARRFGIDMNAYPRLSAIDAHCRALDAFATAAPEAQPDAPAARS